VTGFPAESPEPQGTGWSTARTDLYRRLLDEHIDADALHQLLTEKGPAILDRSIPYLVVAIRNRRRSTARRDARREELENSGGWAVADQQVAETPLDPFRVVVGRTDLAPVLDELGAMDPSYSWPLWWHSAGYSDAEIVERWREAGFEPEDPSLGLIRKRRQRARTVLADAWRKGQMEESLGADHDRERR
jgi:hypothetical protein